MIAAQPGAFGAATSSDGGAGGRLDGKTEGTEVTLWSTEEAGSQGAATTTANSSDRWQRHDLCASWFTNLAGVPQYPGSFADGIPDCDLNGTYPLPDTFCPEGEAPLAPWWRSEYLGGGAYGPWRQVGSYQCATDIIYAQVAQEWARMPIAPNTFTLTPGDGWAVAELGVITIADTNPRTMDVTILGTPVTIRAVATSYAWTADDGSSFTTSHPGLPYDQGGTPWSLAPDEHRATVSLTTTWRGEYTTNSGATWRDAPGTATTTSPGQTIHVYNPHHHLVDCDLNGHCRSGNAAPSIPKTLLDPDADGIDNYLIPDHLIDDYLAARDGGRTWQDPSRKSFD